MLARLIFMAGAFILSAGVSAQASDTITIGCQAPNGGFTIDGANYTVLVYGESGEYPVQAEGSLLQLWSCGWEDGCKWLSYTAYPDSDWDIVNAGGVRIIMQQLVPTLSCEGFQPPMANFPVTVKKNRALPLKAILYDASGASVSDLDIYAPPVVQVWFDPMDGGDAIDVSEEVLGVGLGTEGNQFVYTDGTHWQFNLMTKGYTAPGTYTVYLGSGDAQEYIFDSSLCTTQFVVR